VQQHLAVSIHATSEEIKSLQQPLWLLFFSLLVSIHATSEEIKSVSLSLNKVWDTCFHSCDFRRNQKQAQQQGSNPDESFHSCDFRRNQKHLTISFAINYHGGFHSCDFRRNQKSLLVKPALSLESSIPFPRGSKFLSFYWEFIAIKPSLNTLKPSPSRRPEGVDERIRVSAISRPPRKDPSHSFKISKI
jgi:hypothetical protein